MSKVSDVLKLGAVNFTAKFATQQLNDNDEIHPLDLCRQTKLFVLSRPQFKIATSKPIHDQKVSLWSRVSTFEVIKLDSLQKSKQVNSYRYAEMLETFLNVELQRVRQDNRRFKLRHCLYRQVMGFQCQNLATLHGHQNLPIPDFFIEPF